MLLLHGTILARPTNTGFFPVSPTDQGSRLRSRNRTDRTGGWSPR